MAIHHKVILSLGSNIGDRKDNIKKCLALINNEIGIILTISKIYESPAWGFESDAFYNCSIIVNTSFSPTKILNKIASIEKKLGRHKKTANGYEARIIDIDIIAIEDLIFHSKKLNIPHLEMQNRLFVLLPMLDFNLIWQHPVLKRNILQLIDNCKDTSECFAVDSLENNFNSFNFNSLRYLVIEGNIGAGKTTLVKKIASDFQAIPVFERFAENPFLPMFYKNPKRFSLSLEMSFLADRFQQLNEAILLKKQAENFLISDYQLFKSLLFAKITLKEETFKLFEKIFTILNKGMVKPDLYVFLQQDTNQLLKNIKTRGRGYEKKINAKYLEKINKSYKHHLLTQTDCNTLIINATHLDFVKNNEDYIKILNLISAKINEK